ncbi:MAG: hypothetical protein ACR2JW_19090 [Thermomicrobiales bacterium]
MTIYELWDEEAAFLIDTYSDMSDAFDVVATTYREHGKSAVQGWRLLRSTPSGESVVAIAQGRGLGYLATEYHPFQPHAD